MVIVIVVHAGDLHGHWDACCFITEDSTLGPAGGSLLLHPLTAAVEPIPPDE